MVKSFDQLLGLRLIPAAALLKPRTCELDQLVRPNVTHGYLPVANIHANSMRAD